MQACKAEVSVVRKGWAASCFRRPNIDELHVQELHSQRCHGDAHPGYGLNILNERARSALRAEAGEDAAQRIYGAMAATLPGRLEAVARDLMDGRPNKKTIGQ
jgi:hypothetical protein